MATSMSAIFRLKETALIITSYSVIVTVVKPKTEYVTRMRRKEMYTKCSWRMRPHGKQARKLLTSGRLVIDLRSEDSESVGVAQDFSNWRLWQ
jgi:hypothetical protein